MCYEIRRAETTLNEIWRGAVGRRMDRKTMRGRTREQVDAGGMLEQEGKSRALQPWTSTEWSCWRNTLRSVLQN
jgi:hypothetical protein